ncbi:zinc finger protein ZFPM1 [Erinaceus europaeus]|uniref:Zinc finger protein ZFPM1 n=1 Tax=Erinaceus europaeus TaxID=9365 RepID=A0ABM3WWR1_ERIEU|nr:zinc finger protein ZFPM1 [Erinaceus europaeus]
MGAWPRVTAPPARPRSSRPGGGRRSAARCPRGLRKGSGGRGVRPRAEEPTARRLRGPRARSAGPWPSALAARRLRAGRGGLGARTAAAVEPGGRGHEPPCGPAVSLPPAALQGLEAASGKARGAGDMSRRKQSNPRQIKRSLGDMETREEAQPTDIHSPEQEATTAEATGDTETLSPASSDAKPPPRSPTPPGRPEELEEQELEKPQLEEEEEEASGSWNCPDELELVLESGQRCVRTRQSLTEGLCWGPFRGNIQNRASSPGQAEPSSVPTLLLEDEYCWLRTLPQAPSEAEANTEIYRKGWYPSASPVLSAGWRASALPGQP